MTKNKPFIDKNTDDPNAADRKKDHIDLAFESHVNQNLIDQRFFYEPLLSGHPKNTKNISKTFLGHQFRNPIWVSSMTGGTALAGTININLAKACAEFGMGMGLGSCRSLLYSDDYLQDFAVRKYIDNQPLYANLGIAQIEQLIDNNEISLITNLISKLEANGLIIHINPLQEWLQPEGDIIKHAPLDTIKRVIDHIDTSIIIKEVGQGMGPESLQALMQLPIDAIEFAAHGGTNFAQLELLRSDDTKQQLYGAISRLGHSAVDMVNLYNDIVVSVTNKNVAPEVIISGGVKDFLDGYYLINKLKGNAIYGQASSFLNYATKDYRLLQEYVFAQIKGLQLANCYLKIRN